DRLPQRGRARPAGKDRHGLPGVQPALGAACPRHLSARIEAPTSCACLPQKAPERTNAMLTKDQTTLVTQLSGTWPAPLKLTLSGEKPAGLGRHALGQEITALSEGRPASLPFFVSTKDEVAWFTLGPNDQELRAAVEDLRAWVLPSFAWEDPRGAM